MRKPATRIHILLGVALLLLAGVAWALVSGIEVISPGKVGSNTSEQIEVTVKNGDNPVPDAKILVTTDYGWVQRGEVFPEKARIGELKLLEDQTQHGDKVKRAVYTADSEGHVAFFFYGDPADVGREATVIIRELSGSFQTSFRIKIGSTQLVRGDPLPVCTPVLLDKQADAGNASDPVFVLWVGFEDSSGKLIDIDDAEAHVPCASLTEGVTVLIDDTEMFDRYVAVLLKHVPVSGATVEIQLIGQNGVAAAGTINTGDSPDPRGSDTSLWRN